MNYKLFGLLIAVIIALLGLVIVLLNNQPKQQASIPTPTSTTEVIKPARLDPHRGYFKKSEPGKYEYETPK